MMHKVLRAPERVKIELQQTIIFHGPVCYHLYDTWPHSDLKYIILGLRMLHCDRDGYLLER